MQVCVFAVSVCVYKCCVCVSLCVHVCKRICATPEKCQRKIAYKKLNCQNKAQWAKTAINRLKNFQNNSKKTYGKKKKKKLF